MLKTKFWLVLLIPLILFGRTSPPRADYDFALLKKNPREKKQPAVKSDDQPIGCADRSNPEFWKNLSFLPVKFVGREDKEVLVGQFASPTVFSAVLIKFRVVPETNDEKKIFFEQKKGWNEEITRRQFFKKHKKHFWFLSYLNFNEENIICEAHQFQNWQTLEASYAEGAKNFDVKTLDFWKNLKAMDVYFAEVKKNQAFWFFLKELSELPQNMGETVKLQNGILVSKYQIFPDKVVAEIADHGFFIIDDNCVFHVVERKNPRIIKVPRTSMQFDWGNTKIRARPVNKEYFLKNLSGNSWLCFYQKNNENKSMILLRVVGWVEENNSNNNGNDRNGNKGNEKKKKMNLAPHLRGF